MRESSLVPTNLLNWPRVAVLLPEQKFILQSLWSSPFIKSIGVGELPLRPFASSLGIESEPVMTGIKNLINEGLLVFDVETNEIFIVDWFRFHKFKPKSAEIAKSEIKKVRSESLRKLILEKTITYFPTATATATATKAEAVKPTATATASNQNLKPKLPVAAPSTSSRDQTEVDKLDELMKPFLKNAMDGERWKSLKRDFACDTLHAAIIDLLGAGNQPYTSLISKKLKPRSGNTPVTTIYASHPPAVIPVAKASTPEVTAAGLVAIRAVITPSRA